MRRLFGTLALAAAVLVVAAFAATASPPKAEASWWGNVTKIADHIKYHHDVLSLPKDDGEYPPIGNNGRGGDIVVRPDGRGVKRPIDEFEEGDEIWACVDDWCFGELIEGDDFLPGGGWVRVWFKPLFRPLFADVLFADTPDQVTSESTDYDELVTWVVAGNPASTFNICTYYEWMNNQ